MTKEGVSHAVVDLAGGMLCKFLKDLTRMELTVHMFTAESFVLWFSFL